MPAQITYTTRQAYGNTRLTLAADPQSQAIAQLTGRKTLSPADFEALATLGLEIKEA